MGSKLINYILPPPAYTVAYRGHTTIKVNSELRSLFSKDKTGRADYGHFRHLCIYFSLPLIFLWFGQITGLSEFEVSPAPPFLPSTMVFSSCVSRLSLT